MDNYTFTPIGIVHSPYKEKFAIPRQPGLVTAAQSYIELLGDCNREDTLRGLNGFSHIWLSFVFHEAIKTDWKPMVRPPRLGGNKKVGVFASRSPFRPNPIGLSVVEVTEIQRTKRNGQADSWRIHFKGGDLLDGTPVLDIKPYLPYVDAIGNAKGGFAEHAPVTDTQIVFTEQAEAQLQSAEALHQDLRDLITQVLAQQPQPAYQDTNNRAYGVKLYDYNVRWKQQSNTLEVFEILDITN